MTTSERHFVISVDVEEDINSYLTDSYFGIREGLPLLLDLFNEMGIKSCFFLLGHICEKFPELAQQISEAGHQIGCHGYRHERLYFRSVRFQFRELGRATRAVAVASGVRPRLFRATRFSATERTLRVLERLGYSIDSSILPESKATTLRGKVPIRSTYGAPLEPYHPDRRNMLRHGDSPIWEVPLTVNPIFPGAPMSMGGLNTFGISRMNVALGRVRTRNVIFLIHPWEFTDLGRHYPGLKDWVKKLCAPNGDGLREFLGEAEKTFQLGSFDSLGLPDAAGRGT